MLVDTCCGRLSVEVVGEGPDVVLWPSLLTDRSLWHHQLPTLAEEFRVVTIDPPGHGRSAPTRHPYSLDACVGAALSIMDAVDARVAAWCGLSWGGMVGMRLAARHPRRVSSLILADTTARTAAWWQRLQFGLLAAVARRIGPVPALVKNVTPMMFAHPAAQAGEVRRWQASVRALDRASIGFAVDAVLLSRDDVSELVRSIVAPTLVIVGEEDAALPVSDAQHLVRHIPGAELVTLPGAGHLSCLEAPELFTEHVVRFLERRPAEAVARAADARFG